MDRKINCPSSEKSQQLTMGKKIFEEIGESGFRIMIIIALGALALYLIGTDGNSTVGQAFSALVQKITNWAM